MKLALTALCAVATIAHAQNSFVRVNQIGYESGLPARAFLMTTGSPVAPQFSIVDQNGNTVASGPVGANLAAWTGFSVYPLDFTAPAPGTYTIAVPAPSAATSLVFAVDTAASLFTPALANSLSFYQNQRDGPNYIPSALRAAPAHLNDQQAAVYLTPTFGKNDVLAGTMAPAGNSIDASGGWLDAGDYLKFVETISYVVDLMLAGVRDFPQAMANFQDEARFGVDWLMKMYDDSNQALYIQVGLASGNGKILGDHDIWRLPQADDTYGGSSAAGQYIRNRPVFMGGAPGSPVSPNLAGRLAAAFAQCYMVFRNLDPGYAATCLRAAEHIFDLANFAPSTPLVTTTPYDFYPETEWRDDMELGATELYFALRAGALHLAPGLPHANPLFYLRLAAHWANAYIQGPNDGADTLNLYDVSGLAHFELYRAIEANPHEPLEVTQSALLGDLKKQIGLAVKQAAKDSFGSGVAWNSGDTVSHLGGLAVMAQEYDFLTHSQDYAANGRQWLDNVLGANAWGASFIVGDGSVYSHCMQSQIPNLAGSLDGTPPILTGAVVEGPTSAATKGLVDGMRSCPADGSDVFAQFNGNKAVFKDNVQSYSTDEPAVDLTATSFLAFAWRIAGAPASPVESTPPHPR